VGLPSGKGCCGSLRQQRWVIDEKLVMGKKLGFVRTCGLEVAVWQSSSRIYTQLLMNKGAL
jgi:hypothetical protein